MPSKVFLCSWGQAWERGLYESRLGQVWGNPLTLPPGLLTLMPRHLPGTTSFSKNLPLGHLPPE